MLINRTKNCNIACVLDKRKRNLTETGFDLFYVLGSATWMTNGRI